MNYEFSRFGVFNFPAPFISELSETSNEITSK